MGVTRYPIAWQGIFDTIQGEGELLGTPMHFVRLAGCSVGCKDCDTDYTVAERLTAAEIVERLQRLPTRAWVWVTGGEPTDHDVGPLMLALRCQGYHTAMATAGTFSFDGWNGWPCNFLSVSPHHADDRWKQRTGNQINLVPGLNGLRLDDIDVPTVERMFAYRYVTPLYGSAESLAEAVGFVRRHPLWKLGVQAHRAWGLP